MASQGPKIAQKAFQASTLPPQTTENRLETPEYPQNLLKMALQGPKII